MSEFPSGIFDGEGTDLMSSLSGNLSDGILDQEFQLRDPLSLETSVGLTGPLSSRDSMITHSDPLIAGGSAGLNVAGTSYGNRVSAAVSVSSDPL